MLRMVFAALALSSVFLLPFAACASEEQATLAVTTLEPRATYQLGERIPIDLRFTGPGNEQFEITMASYDRSGRMAYEQFDVEPGSGWSDPLAVYFGSQSGFMGGGLSSTGFLSPSPAVIHLNLNEWIRFDRPGSYTVTVTSHRVSNTLDPNRTISHPSDFALKSNPLQLKIVPAVSSWQKAKLAAIVDELAAGAPPSGILPPAREAAIADLRFLGTPAAALVMAQHLRDDEPTMVNQCAFGLIGLPEPVRPKAIAAMNRLILDPDFPVSQWFLITLSTLQVAADDPEKQREGRARFHDLDWESVVEALPAKRGGARAATVQTLLNDQPAEMTQQVRLELGGVLRTGLRDLPPQKQASTLEWSWDLIGSPDLLPTLQELAQTPPKDPGSNVATISTTRELKSIALKRWYELDPEGARQEIFRQIGSAHPSMTAESLYFLENESLPQFEGVWADGFVAAKDYQQETVFASLLAHFGTGSAIAALRHKTEADVGVWPCAAQGAALGYLVRFDPASARSLVERAVEARGPGKTACNHSIFQDITRYAHDPMLNEVAIHALDDADLQVAMDALIYLASYGQASDEGPIADRFRIWSEQWRGRGEELGTCKPGSLAGDWQDAGLGENLASALIANQGWLAGEKLIQTTLDQCAGEQMCGHLHQLADRARTQPFYVSAYKQGENENYEIAQYSAKSLDLLSAKIAQFPRGSRFILTSAGPATGDQSRLDASVKQLLEEHGMTVEPNAH